MTVIPDTSLLVNKWDNTTKLYTGFSSIDVIDNIKNKFAFLLVIKKLKYYWKIIMLFWLFNFLKTYDS